MPSPATFSFIFGLFKQTNITILQQINIKNVHLVAGAEIQTDDFHNVSPPITTRPGRPTFFNSKEDRKVVKKFFFLRGQTILLCQNNVKSIINALNGPRTKYNDIERVW